MRFVIPALLLLAIGCDSADDSGKETGSSTHITYAEDEDNDGYYGGDDGEDCDDQDASVHPGATEICNGLDDDCDGETDEDVTTIYYEDADSDGFGQIDETIEGCEKPSGYVLNGNDCNDEEELAYPGAPEICDGLDNDCNGEVDEGVSETYYADADGDTYGDPDSEQTGCSQPAGTVSNAEDCDDTSDMAYPGNTEVCDEIDNNCDGQVDEGVSTTYYADMDNDGYGDAAVTTQACSVPTGYVENALDCNDSDSAINPGQDEYCNLIDDNCDGVVDEDTSVDAKTWYMDYDSDGFGNVTVTDVECYQPSGYVADNTDCDDARAETNPAATEYCNSHDDNCDGNIDEDTAADALNWYLDADSDGYGNAAVIDVECYQPSGYVSDNTDCDDARSSTNPGADEYCNYIDDNCDGYTDEDTALDAKVWHEDADHDTYGNAAVTDTECYQPSGYVLDDTDCDDTTSSVSPSADEYCNGIDDNCDGDIDEDTAVDASLWYADTDADGFGDPDVTDTECYEPSGFVADNTDCDDERAATNPDADEYCNGLDDNCDGDIDEATAVDVSEWYQDYDEDGYGNPASAEDSCYQPSGYVGDKTDCDDTRYETNPAADEYCNYIDDNCNGTVDESTAVDASIWYHDSDSDGYGDPAVSDIACYEPTDYVSDNTDCDDSRAATNPGADEYCNGHDDDCDGTTDEDSAIDATTWYADDDSDSYGDASDSQVDCYQPTGYVEDDTDCDDGRYETNPGATEYCNGYDDNCDGTTDEDSAADAQYWYLDSDSDGFGNASVFSEECYQPTGYVSDNTDCDDGRALTNPSAYEYCNSIDDDCDGVADEDDALDAATWYQDADGDNYGNSSVTDVECYQPSGYVSDDTDCDDTTSTTYPGANEYCNSVDDDCNGTVDDDYSLDAITWYADADGDAYGDATTTYSSCSAPSGYLADNTDCDDSSASVYPGATESCNGIDDDCDGTVDNDATDDATWYQDSDGDGYGNSSVSIESCTEPSGYVLDDSDCDDSVSYSYPGADEICDGDDNDCDGTVDNDPIDGDTYYLDSDGDGLGDASNTTTACSAGSGYADNAYDCNDSDSTEPVVVDISSGSSSGSGTLSSPMDSIQDGIDRSWECVIVYGGTYDEKVDFDGKSIDVWGVEGADSTYIDASLSTCSYSNPSDCDSTVTLDSGTGASPTIHGFTITGGTGYVSSYSTSDTCADSSASHAGTNTCTVTVYEYCGGGVYVEGDDPSFYDVIIKGNNLPEFDQQSVGDFSQYWLYSYGGGICSVGGNVSLEDVEVYDNFADQGGGIYGTTSATYTVIHSSVMDNEATDGGGVNMDAASISASNTIIGCNDADTDGGGIFLQSSGGSASLVNVALYQDSSSTGSSHGAAIYGEGGTSVSMRNSIVSTSIYAYALYGSGSSGSFSYNDIYNSYSSGYTFGGSFSAGTGAISSNPQYGGVSCDGNPNNDDFTLSSSSSAVDAGNPSASYNDTDGTRNDMGVYGGPSGDW